MIKKTFPLVSIGFKVLAIILTIFVFCISILICIYNALWYALLFSWLVTIFCMLATVICFLNKIVVDLQSRQIVVYAPKRKKIRINEILSIKIDTLNSVNSKKYCYIVFNLIDGSILKFSGFTTIFRGRAVDRTRNLINNLTVFLHK